MSGTVTYVEGDLFDQEGLDAIGQGVNCVGAMGAGIAAAFRSRYPEMYQEYRLTCRCGLLRPGQFLYWPDKSATVGPRAVYSLATQDKTGRDARLDAIVESLEAVIDHAVRHSVRTLGLPRLGAGIGGLAWRDVRSVIESTVAGTGLDVRVVSLPGA